MDAGAETEAGAKTGTGAATGADPEVPAGRRWKSYAIALVLLLGVGMLLAWRPVRPSFLVPGWLTWLFAGGGQGDGFFAIAVVLAAGMAQDAVDLLLARRRRAIAYLLAIVAIAGLAALAVWSWRHGRPIVAVMAALMATVGPLARLLFPGLPRATARYRRKQA